MGIHARSGAASRSAFAAAGALTVALACVSATAATAAEDCETIVIGSALSLSGKYGESGVHTKNGYEYAIRRIDEAGGVTVAGRCHRFEILYYDDESKGRRAATLAERLIDQDGVRYMLGPYSSGITRAVVPVTEQRRVPMVQAQGASLSLFSKGHSHLFAVLSTSEQYLSSAIALAAEQAGKQGRKASDIRIAVAVENDPFSLDVRAGVLDDAERHGMTVVLDETLPRDMDDMTPILTRTRQLSPDILVVSGHADGAKTAARQIAEQGVAVPMVALTHCEVADVTAVAGTGANGLLCATQWAETLRYEDPVFGTAAEFEAGFRQAFVEYSDRPMPYQVAQAAAAVYVFKDAFERAGTLDKDAVRDAIAETDLATFYGPIRFSDTGRNIAKPMVLRQIQDGAYNVVAPSAYASHALNWPRGGTEEARVDD